MSQQNPFQNVSHYYENQDPAQVVRTSLATDLVSKPNNKDTYLTFTGQETDIGLDSHIPKNYNEFMKNNKKVFAGPPPSDNKDSFKAQQLIDLQTVRSKLFVRGPRGMVGLKKNFKMMDRDNSNCLNFQEFYQGLLNMKLDLKELRAKNLFDLADADKSGAVNIDEFIDLLVGPLNSFRQRLIDLAFKTLDRNGNGFLEIVELESSFNGRRHPECISGEKTAEECKVEFMSLLKSHHNSSTGFKGSMRVSHKDFKKYHEIMSIFYERDNDFRNLLLGIWSIDLRQVDPQSAGGQRPKSVGKTSKE